VSREVDNNNGMSKTVKLVTKEAMALRTKVEQFKTEQGVQEQVIKDTKEGLALCSGELSASQAREEKSQEALRASQEALRVERKNQKVVKDEHARHRKKVAAQLKTAKADAEDARKELKHNVKYMAEENLRKAKITWKAMIEGAKGVMVKLERQEEGHQQEVERMTQGHEQAVGQLTGAHASALYEVRDQVSTLEENLNASTFCCVCDANQKDTVLEPCGHVCLCEECATTVTRTDNKCPLCTVEITGRRKVYL
jgi:chromosome segregation ATPase